MTFTGLQLLVALATLAPPQSHDTIYLSLGQAREVAHSEAPSARAAQARLDIARGASRSLATYPHNPRAEVKTAGLIDPGGSGDYEARLSQEFEWAGQSGLRSAVARSSETSAAADYDRSMSLFAAEVDIAFYALLAATEKARVWDEAAALGRALREAVDAERREGAGTLLDANLAGIQAARAEVASYSARADVTAAAGTLARLLGLDPTAPIVPSGGAGGPTALPPIETWMEEAMQARADLSAARYRIEEAEARSSLATRSAIPNVDLAAVASRAAETAPTTLGLNVSVGLPLWNRNQGARDEAQARIRLRSEEERDLALGVRAEVSAAWERTNAAVAGLALYDSDVLAQARENRSLLDRARSAGQLDLATTVVLQSQVIEAELDYWDVWLGARVAEASLHAAVGRGF